MELPVRRSSRAVLGLLAWPPVVGAAMGLALAWWAGRSGTDERDLGGEGRARAMASFIDYALGFVLATAILHGIGIALGLAFARSNRGGAWTGRVFGAFGCVAGAMLLAS